VAQGYYALMLHAHLPFVRHPERDYFLEENWLFEAITETYLPLLQMFERLTREGVPFRLTMSITPPLVNMLQDSLLQYRYKRHMEKLIELAEKEKARTRDGREKIMANLYHRRFSTALDYYLHDINMDMIARFREFQERGVLDIVTCSATHTFLPLVKRQETIKAQLATARDCHRRAFGVNPVGIWLAECGFYPPLAPLLHQTGLVYFFAEAATFDTSDPQAVYGVHAPVTCREAPVAAFARDMEASSQVWHAKIGYPGDFAYREFYRDIGFDLDFDYIKPYIDPEGIRINTGIKYKSITGPTEDKQAYNPFTAIERASQHADHFLSNRIAQIQHLSRNMDRPPLVVTPFDAELFGHWWYEGPLFLEFLIKKMHYNQDVVAMVTPADYLERYPVNQQVSLPYSSWGEKGYADFWLSEPNAWIYQHLHTMEDRMVEMAVNHRGAQGTLARALNQCMRELFLAQSSDWAFIMRNATSVQYAERRTKNHINRFNTLYEQVKHGTIDEAYLAELASRDNIFPDIDFHWFLPEFQLHG